MTAASQMRAQIRRQDFALMRWLRGDVILRQRSMATVVRVKIEAQTETPCKNGSNLHSTAPRIHAVM